MCEHVCVGVDSGLIWLSWDENLKYGTWPLLLPSSASYMMTTDGQVGMNCRCRSTHMHIFLSVVEPAAKVGMQPSKAGSKSKLQKKSSTSVTRSRSDVSTRTSSSGLVNTSTTGPAVEREEGRRRGQERLNRDLLRTLAETHCIHAEVCSLLFAHTHAHKLSILLSYHSVQCTI